MLRTTYVVRFYGVLQRPSEPGKGYFSQPLKFMHKLGVGRSHHCLRRSSMVA
jgi:hypothetical protein